MATINSLSALNIPTGSENVVIENNDNNYKMAYKPVLALRMELPAQASINDAINAALNQLRERYGDLDGYHMIFQASIPDWSNGIIVTVDTLRAVQYLGWYGIAFSQRYGVYAFSRFDTIGGSAGTLRVSELGSGLA